MIRHIDVAEWEDLRRRVAEEHDLTTLVTVLCDIVPAAQEEADLRRLRDMLVEIATAAERKEQEAINGSIELSTGLCGESNPNELLDRLLLLDRRVMEASMRIYNVPKQDKVILEAERRRLHDTIRKETTR